MIDRYRERPRAGRFTAGLVVAVVIALAACGGDEPAATAATTTTTAAAATTTTTTTTTTAAPATTSPDRTAGVALDGDTVDVHYTGTLDDGSQFDSSVGSDPLRFTLGAGQVIDGFEAAVRGMAVGETVTVSIEPEDAYGEWDPAFVLEFPSDGAPEGLAAGDTVQLSNGAPATVLEVTADVVRVDANPPLAGQRLTFEIELVAIVG